MKGLYDANSVVSYNTSSSQWVTLCGGVSGTVRSVAILGDEVFIGGSISYVTTCDKPAQVVIVNNIAVFNVSSRSWSRDNRIGQQNALITSLAASKLGDGTPYLVVAGVQYSQYQGAIPFIASLNLSSYSWTSMTDWFQSEATNVYSVVAIDPTTNDIYVGGSFATINDVPLNNIAKWNRSQSYWVPLGGGVYYVARINSIDFTSDSRVVIGGYFQGVSNSDSGQQVIDTNNVAMWNQEEWIPLGKGVTGGSAMSCITQAAIVEDVRND